MAPTPPVLGSLTWLPAAEHPELLGAPVAAALSQLAGPAWVAEIDDELAAKLNGRTTFSDRDEPL